MAKTKIARIRYVDEYEQAPKSAEYIGSTKTLWAEKPAWMREDYEEEF